MTTARASFQTPRPLGDLARDAQYQQDVNYYMGKGASNLLIWFVVLALIFWAVLYFFKPKVVQKVGLDGRPTGVSDVGKSLLGGLLIALLIVLIIWLFRACK